MATLEGSGAARAAGDLETLALLDLARTIDAETTGGPAALVEPLRAALSATELGLVGFERRADGVGVSSVQGTRRFARLGARLQWVRHGLERFAFFDPAAADGFEQNVPLTLSELSARAPARKAALLDLLGSVGLDGHDLLRALVCADGEVLLWVGAFRRAPFRERERAVLATVAAALRDRITVERRLREGGIATAGLRAALDALSGAAFLTRPGGVVVFANAAGRTLLQRDPPSVRRALEDGGDPRFARSRLPVPGVPPHWLVVERAPGGGACARLGAAAARWTLTPRETEVLALVARGKCNKEVAASLGCAEATVERHVTALLAKSGCEHRSGIVARFWTEP